MSSTVALAMLWALVPTAEPEIRSPSWPAFSPEIVQAAQERREARAHQPARRAPKTRQSEPLKLKPTRESLLAYLGDFRPSKKPEDVLPLGAPALEVLLGILADETISPRYQEPAIPLIVAFGMKNYKPYEYAPRHFREHVPPPAESRDLSEDAARISDAILDYCARHPDISPGNIAAIISREKLPQILEMAEKARDMAQVAWIAAFQYLTHTKFYTSSSYGFCGHDSPASVEQSVNDDKDRQASAPKKMRKWWDEYKEKTPADWAMDAVKAQIDRRRTWAEKDPEQEHHASTDHVTFDFYNATGLAVGPSLYGWLCDRYTSAAPFIKPFLLGLIANTRHADAATFVMDRLNDPDEAVRQMAIRGLEVACTAAHATQIPKLLAEVTGVDNGNTTKKVLKSILWRSSITDLVSLAKDEEQGFSLVVRFLLDEYLPGHADDLRRLIERLDDPVLAGALRDLLEKKSVQRTPHEPEKVQSPRHVLLASVRNLLKSTNAESVTKGMRLVRSDALIELMPLVVSHFDSEDEIVRKIATYTVAQIGVPDLTVDNAPRLMGYSIWLDRDIAAYCYAKYGRQALPIVTRAVMSYSADSEPNKSRPPRPPIGLIEVLVENNVGGISEKVIKLALYRYRGYSRFVRLLGLLNDARSAAIIGELLLSDEPNVRSAAIELVRKRRLVQFSDRLHERIRSACKLEAAGEAGKEETAAQLAYEKYSRLAVVCQDHPEDTIRAALALIEFGDSHTWDAVHRVLDYQCSDWKHLDGGSKVSNTLQELSHVLAAHLADHRPAARKMLAHELVGEKRYWVISTLTTALCLDPDPSDRDVLLAVATSDVATRADRTLAAIALANVNDHRAIPILHQLVQMTLEETRRDASVFCGPWFVRTLRYPRIPLEGDRDLLNDQIRPERFVPLYKTRYVSLGEALRSLGDDSLVEETIRSLIDAHGNFNETAYKLLHDMIGPQSQVRMKEYLEKVDPEMAARIGHVPITAHDELDPAYALSFCVANPDLLPPDWVAPIFATHRYAPAGDYLVAAYESAKREGSYEWYNRILVCTLCEIGDKRGLALASSDPFLAGAVKRYVPEVRLADFPQGSFLYTRIQDQQRFHEWFVANEHNLRWDSDTAIFTVASTKK